MLEFNIGDKVKYNGFDPCVFKHVDEIGVIEGFYTCPDDGRIATVRFSDDFIQHVMVSCLTLIKSS